MVQRTLSLILALAFAFVFIESFSFGKRLLFVGILLGITIFVNLALHLSGLQRKSDSTFLLLPLFFIFASLAAVTVLPRGYLRIMVLALSAVVFFGAELRLRPRIASQLFFDNVFLLSTFGIFLGIWAGEFFLTPAWWIIIGALFLSSLILFWYGFYPSPLPNFEKFVYSLISALILAQAGWALLLLPLHYLTVAVVFTSFFFLIWELTRFHIRGSLTRQKVIFHLVIVGLLVMASFYGAKWLPNT